ncbi:uncharacterized protein EI90DRAFT_2587533 [Cantharellus anzutake]|uniref:uncharacterized protein n=1 Tax=Cantharellus anzutake TaxID=1750568 RepID=UPI001908C92B|nr:uncharacterized protein EI90DRAFT_2587533 [Cantharellus anzutake]KAF8320984.1 hypothetical protein EI90DRAFT_2587533 [Cantharellus anzutake]
MHLFLLHLEFQWRFQLMTENSEVSGSLDRRPHIVTRNFLFCIALNETSTCGPFASSAPFLVAPGHPSPQWSAGSSDIKITGCIYFIDISARLYLETIRQTASVLTRIITPLHFLLRFRAPWSKLPAHDLTSSRYPKRRSQVSVPPILYVHW